MRHLYILSKNVIGSCTRSITVVGVGSTNPYDMKFEALYSKKENFLVNQGVVIDRTIKE